MRARRLIAVALVIAALLPAPIAAQTTSIAPSAARLPAPGRTIIRLVTPTLRTIDARLAFAAGRSALRAEIGTRLRFAPASSPLLVADLDATAIARLATDPRVASLSPDLMVRPALDESNPASWGLDRIDQASLPIDARFATTGTGAGVDVYVMDTGVDAAHNEFGGRVIAGVDYVGDGAAAASDCHGHGTHVAGTAAGATYGIARSATIVPVRVIACGGYGYLSWVIAGLDWIAATAVSRGRPAVANLSIGAGGIHIETNNAVERAVAAGVVVVLAAGNSTVDACTSSPGAAPNGLTVGATTSTDARAYYSNYGSCLDLFAPGSSITSAATNTGNGATTMSGTSMAAPHVAGVAALVRAADPSLTPAGVRTRLLAAAGVDTVSDAIAGSPNLLLRLSEELLSGATPTPSPTPDSTNKPQ